jgi:hypothetical protein
MTTESPSELFVVTTPLTQHLLKKWLVTRKGRVGQVITASEEEDAILLAFKVRPTRFDWWLCRCDDLLGCRVFNTEAEAISATQV